MINVIFKHHFLCHRKLFLNIDNSFSDDAKKLGAPKDFVVTISQLKVSAGAGFIVALTGAIMTMPGLPKVPASEKIDVDKDGNISGLF